MNAVFTQNRKLVMWLSPCAGAFLSSLFLGFRVLSQTDIGGAFSDFVYWFIINSVVSFVCALPVLGIAYWLGLHKTTAFMFLAALAALPYDWQTSNPINFWHPTLEELEHGRYWDALVLCVFLASATGWVFGWGAGIGKQKPNHPTEPLCQAEVVHRNVGEEI